jgi:8-oxo-dGTP diphosphatase
MGDGNGWVRCRRGHRHWGRFGAAGLLLTTGRDVLLQHRAPWTHEGDTWALPGGARDSHEDAWAAAVREAAEETDLDISPLHPAGTWVDDHGGWSYTTVVVPVAAAAAVRPANAESVALRWWELAAVDALPLHRGFAAAWPQLRALIAETPLP